MTEGPGSFLNPNMTTMSVLFCFKRIDGLPQSPLANIQGGWNLKKQNKTLESGCNPSTPEAEAGELQVENQNEL